jgi:hypothetical protein
MIQLLPSVIDKFLFVFKDELKEQAKIIFFSFNPKIPINFVTINLGRLKILFLTFLKLSHQ